MTYAFLQNYLWGLISLLGGLFVTLLFVQGANQHIGNKRLDRYEKRRVLRTTGHKWILTVLALLAFGGVFFVSFPTFFETGFLGARLIWALVLFTILFQAVFYGFQRGKEKLLGGKALHFILMVNGFLTPFLVGMSADTFFIGAPFSVDKAPATDPSAAAAGTWQSIWHGLEALAEPHSVLLGFALTGLTFLLGSLFLLEYADEGHIQKRMHQSIGRFSIPTAFLLLLWLALLLLRNGYAVDADGTVSVQQYKYLDNLLQMPAVLVMIAVGGGLLVWGLVLGSQIESRKGFWPAAVGTLLAVMGIFFLAGFNGTAYYPSTTDLQSSLTLQNSCTDYDTLNRVFRISLPIPFLVACIAWAWSAISRRKRAAKKSERTENKH